MGNFLKSLGNAVLGGIPGAISAGINLIGSAIGRNKGLEQVREQNKGQMKLAEYQYEKNLEQWMRENEYNSPRSQMQRYADAGLNPNLIYGQGSSGNSGSSPQYEAPKLSSYTDFGDMGASGAVSAFQRQEQLSQLEALRKEQGELMRTQADYNRQRSQTEAVNRLFKEAQQVGQALKNDVFSKYGEKQVLASLNQSFQNVQLMKAQEQKALSDVTVNESRRKLLDEQLNSEVLKQGFTRAQTALVYANIQRVKAELPKIAEEINLLKVNNMLHSEQSVNAAVTRKILEHTEGLKGKEERTWFSRTMLDYFIKIYGVGTGAASAAGKLL